GVFSTSEIKMAARRTRPSPTLRGMQLRRSKSFQDSTMLPLSRLTLVFGRNNSGKSTLLQSLLLLRQTFGSPEYGPRLNPRGPFYDAGTFDDLVHGHTGARFRWAFGLDIRLPGEARLRHLEIAFAS